MKQGKPLITFTILIFAAVIALYLGYYIFGALNEPYQTAQVYSYTANDSVTAEGLVVREALVLPAQSGILELTRAEGEKVGKGQQIALVYRDSQAQASQAHIEELELAIELLEDAVSQSGDLESAARLDENIIQSMVSLRASYALGDCTQLREQVLGVKSSVLKRGYTYGDGLASADLSARLRQLREERARWVNGRTDDLISVTGEDVAAVASEWTGVPVRQITQDEGERLLRLEEELQRRVVGQDQAISAMARAIRRGRVGLGEPNRPIGSFLLLGPSGVGKTELCRALSAALFGQEEAMIRVDMSEYAESHAASRLVGSPPGYVGHEEGGQLTEKVRRRPYAVVLFDEIEKAHPEVWNLLLQILEDGRLTDSQGRRADFRNTVVVMTSNVGARQITSRGRLGFAGEDGQLVRQQRIRDQVTDELKRTFRPEFLNRIDETVVFRQLGEEDLEEIAARLLAETGRRMEALGLTLRVEVGVAAHLAREGFDPASGARPLRRRIQRLVEERVAEELLAGRLRRGDGVKVGLRENELAIEREKE